MNFIEGRVDGGRFHFEMERGTSGVVAPMPSVARSLAAYAGRRVILGVRPEDVAVVPSADAGGAGIMPARLDFVEQMGNEEFVHAIAGTTDITARVAPLRLPEPGSAIVLRPDPARLHFFDADTELRIDA